MKYIPLVLAGLWRKPARTVLTFLSVVVAFILFGILAALEAGIAHQLEIARLDVMVVQSRFGGLMPYVYQNKIGAVPGVAIVAPVAQVGSYWQDPKNPASALMTDARFFAIRSEVQASQSQIEKLLATPGGAIAGTYYVKQYGWKIGDRIPLTSTTTIAQDGSKVWAFDILSIADNADDPGQNNYLVSNYKYLDEARTNNKGTVNIFFVKIKDPAQSAQVSNAIDGIFANSPMPTRTISEKINAQSNFASLGSISFFTRSIIGAVLFMLMFLTGNTMMQSVRERIPEFAVLKTLGFSDKRLLGLVFAEAVTLCALAGVTGLAIVKSVFPSIKAGLPNNLGAVLQMPWTALAVGFGFALLMAFISGIFPALRLMRMNVVDSLAGR